MAIPKEILDLFHQSERFYILGHMEPDGDSLGSQMALTLALNNWGKKATPVSPGPFVRKEILHYEERFASAIPLNKVQDALLVILDCSTQDRLGDLAHLAEATTSIVIDHHANGQEYGTHRWIDPSYPATTLMVQDLLEALEIGTDPCCCPESSSSASPRTQAFTAILMKGSSLTSAAQQNWSKPGLIPKGTLSGLHERGQVSGRTPAPEPHHHPLYSCMTERSSTPWRSKTIRSPILGLENRDTDLLYQLFQAVEGVELVVLATAKSLKIKSQGALRSLTWFPCGDLADRLRWRRASSGCGLRQGRQPARRLKKPSLRSLSDWPFPS
jgi:phosphoesterase RecJ-like protein